MDFAAESLRDPEDLKPKIDLKYLPIPRLNFFNPSKIEIFCLG
jgi:hypothetical protein